MATNYQKLLSILVKWPVNSKKKNRDYGLHLRTLLQRSTANEEIFTGKAVDTLKKLDSLSRLGANIYGLKYPCIHKLGASGMDKNDVEIVLTDEFINYYNESKGLLKIFLK